MLLIAIAQCLCVDAMLACKDLMSHRCLASFLCLKTGIHGDGVAFSSSMPFPSSIAMVRGQLPADTQAMMRSVRGATPMLPPPTPPAGIAMERGVQQNIVRVMAVCDDILKQQLYVRPAYSDILIDLIG